MQQPPSKPWKKAILRTIAQMEHALRGHHLPAPADLQRIRNFLFLQYESPLGSVLHATPVFEALKRAMPDAYIAVAASSMAASVLDRNPFIDRCVITPNPILEFGKAATALRALLQSIPPGPSAILTTIGNQRTRIASLSLMAKATVRVGYTLAPQLYDIALDFHPERGQIEGNLDILRKLGHDVPFCEPRIFSTHEDAEQACRLLDPLAKVADVPRIAFVTQNSGGQRNRWREERFAQVISEMSRFCGAVPVFVGTSVDAAAIESLRQAFPNQGISVAGKTTVPQLAAVLAQCDLAISLDTGTFHVARAVGLPGVVIAPAWQSSLEWLPVDNARYHVLQGSRIPASYPGYSIDEVSAEQVIDAALDLLQHFPPSIAQRAARARNSLSPFSALRQ